MEKFLLDANVILSLFFDIECDGNDAAKLWNWLRGNQESEVYITELDLENILFYVNKVCGEEEALIKRQYLTNLCNICKINPSILKKAYSYQSSNFEASVRIACQEICGIDYIISFQPTIYDFISKTLNSITPQLIFTRYEDDIPFKKQKLENIFSEDYTEDVSNPDFLKIQDYIITKFEVVCGNTKRHPQARIEIKNSKIPLKVVKENGNGPVDAVFKTIQKLISIEELPIKEHHITQIYAVSDGKGSDGIVTVRIGVLSEGKEVKNFCSHTDLLTAAVYAYVAILNELLY